MRRQALTKTDAAILGMLSVEPMSGYDLKRFSEQSLAYFWHESYGNLYPRLARLAGDGLIRGRREGRPRGPDAVVYTLTARGRRRFTAWLAEPAEPEQIRSEFLLKVFFGSRASLDVIERHVAEHQRQQEAIRDRYRDVEKAIRAHLEDRPEMPYWLMSLRRGQLLTRARLRWCHESRALIAEARTRKEER